MPPSALPATAGDPPPSSGRGALDLLHIPGPRVILAGALGFRLLLVVLLLVRPEGISLVLARGTSPGGPVDPAVAVGMLGLIVAAVASLWLLPRLVRIGTSLPSPNALLLQAVADLLLVTALVARERSEGSSLAALYLVILAGYALLLPLGRALITVFAATGSYVAITLWIAELGVIPSANFWGQVGVIAFIGVLVALLGDRLSGERSRHQALRLELAQARLEADEILASIHSGVITVDDQGNLRYVNPRALLILGAQAGGFVANRPVLDVLRTRSRELHDAVVQGIRDGSRISRGEAAVRRDDGTLFPVGLSTTTFQRPGSERSLVTAIFTDISELKRLNEFRLRAERLEAIAALSASLAHEIRNPLMAIRSAVEQLARGAGADEDDQVLAELVRRESERLNRLLSEFLDFSRVRVTRYERVDLLHLVTAAARTVAEHPDAAAVDLVVEGEAISIDADTDLVHRMVSNLLFNAAQAIDGTGRVVLRIGWADAEEIPPGPVRRRVKVTVRDNGPGIPPDVQQRLFEPFATGRPGGTGLGLPIVQRAVAAHQGVILVDTLPGEGTTFTIFLPETANGETIA